MSSMSAFHRCIRLILALALAIPLSGFAAEAKKALFDIPAGPAEQSLKKFAAQSGLEVLFSAETAVRVRTNSVKGSYTPQDAIDQMLAGTPLVATPDPKSGAMKVARVSGTNSEGTRATPMIPAVDCECAAALVCQF